MFKSKFKEMMKEEGSFEIIKDVEALSVEGGACTNLRTCTTYTGDCQSLETCGTYSSEHIVKTR